MPEETQWIDGVLYTKPPEPAIITRETVRGWMDAAVAKQAQDEADLARAIENRTNTQSQLDATVDKFTEDVSDDTSEISDIQAILDAFPE
jgi:hypothetical protein